jgi:hypothetical protein
MSLLFLRNHHTLQNNQLLLPEAHPGANVRKAEMKIPIDKYTEYISM